MGANLDQDAIRDLATRKQNLMLELNNYAENERAAKAESSGKCWQILCNIQIHTIQINLNFTENIFKRFCF